MLNLAYSFKLKKIVIVDVICLGTGYVLRTIAGVGALKTIQPTIAIPYSIILSIFFFAIFINFLKLRQEILIAEIKAVLRQKEFSNYSIEYIDQITPMMLGLSIITYSFYSLIQDKNFENNIIYTIPILLYIGLRYLYLVHIEEEEENENTLGNLILKDKPLIVSGLLFIITFISISFC